MNVSTDEYEMRILPDVRNEDFEFIDVDADTASLYRQYSVFTFDSEGNSETLALGYANFSFRRINARWQIIRWTDVLGLPGDDNSLTFGSLRLEL